MNLYSEYLFVQSMRTYLTKRKTTEKYAILTDFCQKTIFPTLYDVITTNNWYARAIKVGDMSKAFISAKICKVTTLSFIFSYIAEIWGQKGALSPLVLYYYSCTTV